MGIIVGVAIVLGVAACACIAVTRAGEEQDNERH